MSADPFHLERFLEAQKPVFDTALAELGKGRKKTHWMWFIFPQIRGLGTSAMAQTYGIASLAEARAYLDHPVLSARLVLCTEAVLVCPIQSLREIFGSPDDLKFRSSMTLFEAAAAPSSPNVFAQALDWRCAGERDTRTIELIGGQ